MQLLSGKAIDMIGREDNDHGSTSDSISIQVNPQGTGHFENRIKECLKMLVSSIE
jgi:hypothetical protein